MKSDQAIGWLNVDFHAKLAVETTAASGWNSTNDCQPKTNSGPCHLQDMIDSYVEERNWGIYYAHEALGDHPLRTEAVRYMYHVAFRFYPPLLEAFG
jgi:hypothetical protein